MIPHLASHTRKGPERKAYKPQFRQKRKRSRSPAGLRRLGTATRISASLSRRLSAFFGSTHDQAPKAAKFAVLNPGHAGFPKRVERSEGSDTTPISHTHVWHTSHNFDRSEKRSRSPAGPRRLGTATRISASLSRRLSAFFRSVSDQDPKAAKFAVLTPGPGMFVNVQYVSRVVIAAPSETPRVSACKPLCAILLAKASVYPLSPAKTNVGRL